MTGLDHLARIARRMRAVHETWSSGVEEQRRWDDSGNSAISVWENEGGLIVDRPGDVYASRRVATGSVSRAEWSRVSQSRGTGNSGPR